VDFLDLIFTYFRVCCCRFRLSPISFSTGVILLYIRSIASYVGGENTPLRRECVCLNASQEFRLNYFRFPVFFM
jgi:hypothetical protein